jgi:hypothetical protein
MYKGELPTYKKVLTDQRSTNLEPQSHLLVVAYMSRVESLQLLHRDPHRLGKLVSVFGHLDLSEYEISYLKIV